MSLSVLQGAHPECPTKQWPTLTGLCRMLSTVVVLSEIQRKGVEASRQNIPHDKVNLSTLKQLPVCVTCPSFEESVAWYFVPCPGTTNLAKVVRGEAHDTIKSAKDLPSCGNYDGVLMKGLAAVVGPPPYALSFPAMTGASAPPKTHHTEAVTDLYSAEGLKKHPMSEIVRATVAESPHGMVFRMSEAIGTDVGALAQTVDSSLQLRGDTDKQVAPYLTAAYRLVRSYGIEFKNLLTAPKPAAIELSASMAKSASAPHVKARTQAMLWASAFETGYLSKLAEDSDFEDWDVFFRLGTDLTAPIIVDSVRQVGQQSVVAAMMAKSPFEIAALERAACANKYAEELAVSWSDYDLVGLLVLLLRVWGPGEKKQPGTKDRILRRWQTWAIRVLFARHYNQDPFANMVMWIAQVLGKDSVGFLASQDSGRQEVRQFLVLPEDSVAQYDWLGNEAVSRIDVTAQTRINVDPAESVVKQYNRMVQDAGLLEKTTQLLARVEWFVEHFSGKSPAQVTLGDRLKAWQGLWRDDSITEPALAMCKLPIYPALGIVPMTRMVTMPPPRWSRPFITVPASVHNRLLAELTRDNKPAASSSNDAEGSPSPAPAEDTGKGKDAVKTA